MSEMIELPDRILLPLRFDAARLRADLDGLAGKTWTAHFVRQNYSGEWSALPLRSKRGATRPSNMIYADPMCVDFVDTPILEACPYFQEVLAAFPCPIRSARLMRLTPGSEIKEHSDMDLGAEFGKARLHIPIATSDDVDFFLNGTAVAMSPGDCWYLRLSDPHRVLNRGASDRVHLVFDTVVNEWLRGELQAGAGLPLESGVPG
jgi:hypothetical protein